MDAVIPMFIQVKQPGEIFQREAFLQRKRISSWATALGVALYAQGLSLRRTALLLTQLGIHVTHVAAWYWLQRFALNYAPWASSRPDRVLVDETQVKLGRRRCWIWAALHPQNRKCSTCGSAETALSPLRSPSFANWPTSTVDGLRRRSPTVTPTK